MRAMPRPVATRAVAHACARAEQSKLKGIGVLYCKHRTLFPSRTRARADLCRSFWLAV